MIHVEITDIPAGARRSNYYNKAQVTIGKADDNDVVIARPNVSRHHAKLVLKNGAMVVEDLNSTNGTLLNGERVIGSQPFGPEDEVRVGDFSFHAKPKAQESVDDTAITPADDAPKKPPAPPPKPAPPPPPPPAKTEAKPAPAAEAKPADGKPSEPAPSEGAARVDGVEDQILTRDVMYFQTIKGFLGEVGTWLDNPSISEIMINGPNHVYIEKAGHLTLQDFKFKSEDQVLIVIRNIAQYVGRRITEEEPYMDARLPDGSRVACMIRPCCRCGPSISIRKFSNRRLAISDLIGYGSISEDGGRYIDMCVKLHKNTLVSGGTGSGKTTLLNIVSGLIPEEERIIVIEDSSELQLQQEHVLPWESRPKDKEGKGEFSIRDLVKAALRFRPDRIVVGECRGGEALDLLQAMNTGHSGSMATVHASSPTQTLSRVETLALFAGFDIPLIAMRGQVASAIEFIVQTARLRDGSRKVTHLSEVLPLTDQGAFRTQDIFRFIQTGIDAKGKVLGSMVPTGIKPSFYDDFKAYGIEVPPGFFDAKEPARA